ncbi:MAG: sigma-54 dependent transcriptional regulator, partial [Myxococcaceae bacterium]|nr:sigma-54 dependent transcriptional regulator [Myxococcaceae bacterium]
VHVRGQFGGFFFVEGLPGPDGSDREKLAHLLELAADQLARASTTPAQPDTGARAATEVFAGAHRFEDIVGTSAPMREMFRMLEKLIHSDSTVLVNGESGTGKELVARALHSHGPRREKPFVVQNCSAFNDNLLESALFGHVRGSFTGALRDRKGLFETADGGTFFLDEVGDMSPALQVKLLRVLQEGTFLPVGGTTPREVDVRVITATHQDLGQLVERGRFREDLYYRINVIRITVPPLRERQDDLAALVQHFLRKHRRPGDRACALSPDATKILEVYSWPGNIRELENEIERLLVLGADLDVLPPDLLSARIREAVASGGALIPAAARGPLRLDDAVEALERELIAQGLVRTGGNRSRLARELGIARSNLLTKIARYGLDSGRGVEVETDA